MTFLRTAVALGFLALIDCAVADPIDEFVRTTMAVEKTPGLVLVIASSTQGQVIRPYGMAGALIGIQFDSW